MKRILVAGASGMLGRLVVLRLRTAGYYVRILTRSKEKWSSLGIPADEVIAADLRDQRSLNGCCDSIDAVISCAGASMDIKNFSDRSTFSDVDLLGNTHLLHEAKRAGLRKFVYVSVAGAEQLAGTEYGRTHLQFEKELPKSGLEYSIVRPTGFFYFLAEIFSMAQKGRGIVFGDGSSRSNPIHEEDVADACINALTGNEQMITAGGPEVFSRKEIVELAFQVAEREPSIISVPAGLFNILTAPIKLINPRIDALLQFGTAVSTQDVVVQSGGTKTLQRYFAELKAKIR